MIHDVNKKTKEQLLEEFSKHTSHNTLEGEQYTAAIIVKSAAVHKSPEELVKEIEEKEQEITEIMRKIKRNL